LLLIAVAGGRPTALPVQVKGDGRCPQPAEVAARLGALLPPSPGSSDVGYTAELRDDGPELAIVLRGRDGSVAKERRLPRQYTCDELAAAAAAVIAAWMSDIHPEFAIPEPAPGSAGASAPGLARSAPAPAGLPRTPDRAPAPRPPLDAPHAQASPQTTLVAITSVAAAPGVREGVSLSLRLDGAAGLAGTLGPSRGSPGWAAGALVAGGVRWAPTRFGARLALTAGTARVFPLGMGELHVTRTSLSLGPTFRVTGSEAPLAVDLAVLLTGARLVTRGSGFPRATATAGLDGGGGASLRVSLRRDWSPFLELGASAWPVARTGLERVDGNTRPLPQGEVGLTGGVLFTGGGGPVRPAALGPPRE
jgi:hypothetical protein